MSIALIGLTAELRHLYQAVKLTSAGVTGLSLIGLNCAKLRIDGLQVLFLRGPKVEFFLYSP
jgi:hypothetical protein